VFTTLNDVLMELRRIRWNLELSRWLERYGED
jgi:hypothetical protein